MSITQNPKYTFVDEDLEQYTFPSAVNPKQRHYIDRCDSSEWKLGIVQIQESISRDDAVTLMRELEELLAFTEKLNGKRPNLPHAETEDSRPDIRPCPNGKCVEAEHEWMHNAQANSCRLEAIEGDGFIVHGNLFEHGWEAWVDADDLADGHKGIEQSKGLVKAFESMQAACDRLNGSALHRATEPGAPAFEAVV